MRLSEAKLCEDCKEIFITKRCPLCGRESYSYIARWLDRMPNPLEIATSPNTREVDRLMPSNWAFRGGAAQNRWS